VFVEVHDGKFLHAGVEKLDRAIATRDGKLILVDLGPGEVVLRVVRFESTGCASANRISD
jgi:hypothetical protein